MEDKVERDRLLIATMDSLATNAVSTIVNTVSPNLARVRLKAAEFGPNGRAEVTLRQFGGTRDEFNLVSEHSLLVDLCLLLLAAMRLASIASDAARIVYLDGLMAQTLSGNPPAFVDCSTERHSTATFEAVKSNRNQNPFNYPNPRLFESVRAGEIRRRGIDVDVNFSRERKVRLFKAAWGATKIAIEKKMKKGAANAAAAAAESEGGE